MGFSCSNSCCHFSERGLFDSGNLGHAHHLKNTKAKNESDPQGRGGAQWVGTLEDQHSVRARDRLEVAQSWAATETSHRLCHTFESVPDEGQCKVTGWTRLPKDQTEASLRVTSSSILLLPVLRICVEDQPRAALLPLQLNLLLEQTLLCALLAGDVLVQSLMALPLFTTVIILKQEDRGGWVEWGRKQMNDAAEVWPSCCLPLTPSASTGP